MSTIYEVKTFAQLYDAMKRYLVGANSTLNNFNTGARLPVILESIAMLASQSYNDFYQALKKSIPVAVFDGFGFEKLPGNKATGKLTFYVTTAAIQDYPIPEGTSINLNGSIFETTADAILLISTLSIEVAARCSSIGQAGNIALNTINTLIGQGNFVNQPNGIESCLNTLAFAGGTDEETDESRISRFNDFINSLSRSTPLGLIAAAKSVAGVVSVSLIENYPTYGWCTLYVDDGTGALSPVTKSEVLKVLNGDPNDSTNYPGYRAAGIQLQILAPTVQTVNVTAQIKVLYTAISDDADLIISATTAIEQYVNSLRLGEDVIISAMITKVHEAHSDIHDVLVTIPSSNVTITGANLARTVTVSVTATRVGP